MSKNLIYQAILLAVLCFSSTKILACSYAYQYSLFPLGSANNHLIFLEVELERYVNTPAGGGLPMNRFGPNARQIETRWKGSLRLQQLNGDSLSRIRELAYVDISDDTYEEELAPYFQKAMQAASKMEDFQQATFDSIAYCRYDRSCALFQLKVDTLALELKASLNSPEQWQKASFPSVVLHKFENIMKLNFSELETVEASSRINFFQAWKPYSARHYSIGAQKIVVYTLGWGQARGYQGKKDLKWKSNLPPIEECIEGKDVMMHGQRFDFFQILN
jgi:hypothetical protein